MRYSLYCARQGLQIRPDGLLYPANVLFELGINSAFRLWLRRASCSGKKGFLYTECGLRCHNTVCALSWSLVRVERTGIGVLDFR
jgi:hypothetical protein